MDRNDLVTAALAAGGHRVGYFPIHVQKLCFLIDRELASHVGGPYFRFEPFHYGPFDGEVYKALDALADIGRLGKDAEAEPIIYCLTPAGQVAGNAILATLPPRLQTAWSSVPVGSGFSRFEACSRKSTYAIRI